MSRPGVPQEGLVQDALSAYVYHQPHLPVTGAASQSFQELLLSPDEPLKDSGLIVPPSTAQPDYSWATSSTGPGHFCQEAVGVKAEDAATGGVGSVMREGALTHALRMPEVAACVLQLLQPHLLMLSVGRSLQIITNRFDYSLYLSDTKNMSKN